MKKAVHTSQDLDIRRDVGWMGGSLLTGATKVRE